MKIKFNGTCKDKNTGEMYRAGMTKEFDDARASEIISTGYAVECEETNDESIEVENYIDIIDETVDEQTTDNDESIEVVSLSDLTVKELKEMTKEVGVSTSGTKDEIIERLLATQDNE